MLARYSILASIINGQLRAGTARTIEVNIATAVFVGVADHLVDVVFGQVAAELFQDPPTNARGHNWSYSTAD